MQGVNRSATELKLTTRLDGDALPVQDCTNDVMPFHDRFPAKARTQSLKQCFDAIVIYPPVVCQVVAKLFVLCPKPVGSTALAAVGAYVLHVVKHAQVEGVAGFRATLMLAVDEALGLARDIACAVKALTALDSTLVSPPLLFRPTSRTHICHQILFCQLLHCRLSCYSHGAKDAAMPPCSPSPGQGGPATLTRSKTRRGAPESAAMHAASRAI